jgi:hypothetical protein
MRERHVKTALDQTSQEIIVTCEVVSKDIIAQG